MARGEHLGLEAMVADTQGRLIDGAEVEIWQCDALAAYRHPRAAAASPAASTKASRASAPRAATAQGALRFRTIKPVPYPGRTPHIHVKLRHASFGELTSQLFVAGDAGNERDFLWRQVERGRPARAGDGAAAGARPTAGCAGWCGTRWWCRPERPLGAGERALRGRDGRLARPPRQGRRREDQPLD